MQVNPFPPSVAIWYRYTKLSILILKISYERRDYESVDVTLTPGVMQVNPFRPSVAIWYRYTKLSILILKISYERRDYESVDEKSLS